MLMAYEYKSAYALCIFFSCYRAGFWTPYICGKDLGGMIVPARGPNDFEWDPVFQPDGYEQT
ncbi:putative nucleotide diphosphatase [Helianthus anomalus]